MENLKAKSLPEYPVPRRGVVLVIGTSPGWDEAMATALALHPRADICAVDDAVELVEADHIATVQPGTIKDLHQKHLHAWGWKPSRSLCVHYRAPGHDRIEKDLAFFAWDITVEGSVPFAAEIMASLGYDQVILCGCGPNLKGQ